MKFLAVHVKRVAYLLLPLVIWDLVLRGQADLVESRRSVSPLEDPASLWF